MANFNPPFSDSADKRYPTSDERQNGFECGPADQELFNGLFYALQAEVGEVISFAGITQTNDRFTQLREAIEALIEAATGGGDPATYLLISQARSRLPIYPEVQNVDGRIVVTSPSTGTVRIPGGVTFLHRGIFPITTAQTDFSTVASKIYHLRWSAADGYQLIDTGDGTYNPGSLAETDIAFDSSYDSMLIARVITNAANVATITNLSNKNRLLGEIINAGAITQDASANGSQRTAQVNWNFARRPVLSVTPRLINVSGPLAGGRDAFIGADQHDHDFWILPTAQSRYGVSISLLRDYATSFDILCTVNA